MEEFKTEPYIYDCSIEDIKEELNKEREWRANGRSSIGKLYRLYLNIGEDTSLIELAIDQIQNEQNFDENIFLSQLDYPLDPRRNSINYIKQVELVKNGYANYCIKSNISVWPNYELCLLSLKYNTFCFFEAVYHHAEKLLSGESLSAYKRKILDLINERIIELNNPRKLRKSRRKRFYDLFKFNFSKYSYFEIPLHSINKQLYQLNETKKYIINGSLKIDDETIPNLMLTREQVVYLFHLLKKHKIINSINNLKLGEIIHQLTGFSSTTVRRDLNKDNIITLESKNNLEKLDNYLTHIIGDIEMKLKDVL